MESAQKPSIAEPPLIAPWWHTAALVAVMLSVAAVGTFLTRNSAATKPPAGSRLLGAYLPMVLVEWGLLLYVARIGRARSALSLLLGRRWDGVFRACTDVALASLVWVLIEAAEIAWSRWVEASHGGAAHTLLPQSPLEHAAWVVVAASAGFCEEVVYRGYLQTQFSILTGSIGVAIVLQALLFAIAHGEQGPSAMLRLGAYGVVFGLLARWRQSLWPAILCHAGIDLASGFVGS